MNWYKKSGLIKPDQTIVEYMVKQVKPYIQALLINRRVKKLKENQYFIESSLKFNKQVLKDPSILKRQIIWPSDKQLTEQEKQEQIQQQLNKIKNEIPIKEKELQETEEKIKALLSVPKIKLPSIKGKIEIDVPENIIPQDIKNLMSAINRPNMKLVMYYGIRGVAATYDRDYDKSSIAIEIDLTKILKQPQPYEDLVGIIHHELVHSLQHLMGEKFGLPSKSISTPEYTLESYWDMPVRSKKLYPYHSLLDIEFYPRLADRATKLRFLKERYSNLDTNWFKNFIEKDSWLKILKEKAIDKYHKAVNELLKVFQESMEKS